MPRLCASLLAWWLALLCSYVCLNICLAKSKIDPLFVRGGIAALARPLG